MLAIVLGSLLVFAYVGVSLLAVKTLTEAPAFESRKSNFDLRINYGDHVRLIYSKPAIKWETPEAVIPVATERRVPVNLGYRVETMLPF
jgi:hypothetical protein